MFEGGRDPYMPRTQMIDTGTQLIDFRMQKIPSTQLIDFRTQKIPRRTDDRLPHAEDPARSS